MQHGLEEVPFPIPFLGMLGLGLLLGFILKSFVAEYPHRPVRERVASGGLRGTGPRTPYRMERAPSEPDRHKTRR